VAGEQLFKLSDVELAEGTSDDDPHTRRIADRTDGWSVGHPPYATDAPRNVVRGGWRAF
jgi:hypothetical protein